MKNKKVFSLIFCLVFIMGIFSPITAEAQMQQRRATGGQMQRRKARENFLTLWLLKMTQALELSEEQTVKIFPAVNSNEREKMAIQKGIAKSIRDLKLALNQEKTGEQELFDKIKEIKKLRAALKNKEEEFEKYLDKVLSVEQRAKYLVLANEFLRGMRDRLNRARMQQKKRAPQGRIKR